MNQSEIEILAKETGHLQYDITGKIIGDIADAILDNASQSTKSKIPLGLPLRSAKPL